MTDEAQKKAVIYCRISSIKQKTEGDGLGSQETRCREYARYKGHTVEQVFKDEMTGSKDIRPGMSAMLSYIRQKRNQEYVVIIDDISRIARGIEAHLKLRSQIASVGGLLESPSIEFGDDSDSIFHENLMASVAQHQRQKNAEQTMNRMKARVMNGYWVFSAPVGYHYKQVTGRGKMLIRDEPAASLVQEALEGYASGRFQLQSEVQRFLKDCPEYPKSKAGKISPQSISDLLRRTVYAGYVEHENWNISLRKGQHEGLISFETFQKIQQRLQSNARVPARKNLNEEFPLRGAVTCGDCGNILTACFSTGRKARHPYYLCFKKGCESYRKSIRRDEIEGAFETLLKQLKPTEGLFNLAEAMFKELWYHRMDTQKNRKRLLEAEIKKTDKQIEQLLDRIVDADSATVIKAYEKRINKLEAEKIEMKEKITNCGRPLKGYDETFRTAMEFLSNPYKIWASERFENKRAVLKLAFVERLAYVRNEGFRTAKTSLPFSMLGDVLGGENVMVPRPGIEPGTQGFSVLCSTD
jgi:site-specific DNA recombinase